MFVIFEVISITLWLTLDSIFYFFNFTYIGGFIAVGLLLYIKKVKYARQVVQLAVGLYMLVYLGLISNENMQIEGFWYYLFAVQQQVHLAVSYSGIVARINSAPIKKSQSIRLDDLIAAKERELAKITRYKQSIYQDWKDGEFTQQDYRDMKADYERQTITLSDVLARLTAERAEMANGVDNEHPALVAFMKYQNIETLSREILVELVDHIKVYENGNISVKFKFDDELRKIAEYIEINT